MKHLRLTADPGQLAETRVILLPGAYHTAADFVAAGFFDAANQKTPQRFDLVLPEFDLPQLTSGEALPLLHEHLILPARAAGVRRIWLGGVSLGGFNSLCYAERYQDSTGQIDGLCLLAPWPGSRITRRLIDAAGGLDRWSPAPGDLEADTEQRVWYWLRQQRNNDRRLPIFIGWGDQDRFASGIAAYAATMPGAQVETLPGGHDWPLWLQLWQRCCDSGVLSR